MRRVRDGENRIILAKRNFSKRAVSRYLADGGTGREVLVGPDLRPVGVKALLTVLVV